MKTFSTALLASAFVLGMAALSGTASAQGDPLAFEDACNNFRKQGFKNIGEINRALKSNTVLPPDSTVTTPIGTYSNLNDYARAKGFDTADLIHCAMGYTEVPDGGPNVP